MERYLNGRYAPPIFLGNISQWKVCTSYSPWKDISMEGMYLGSVCTMIIMEGMYGEISQWKVCTSYIPRKHISMEGMHLL